MKSFFLQSVCLAGAVALGQAQAGPISPAESLKQFTVFESLSEETVVGSGLTQTKEEQMQNLSRNAAKMIQTWMLEHPEWFPGIGSGKTAAAPASAKAADAAAVAAPAVEG